MPLPSYYFNQDLGYSDLILQKIAILTATEWMKLGIYLNIPNHRLENMFKAKSPSDMALEMLKKWWRNVPPYKRWEELETSFFENKRRDLIDFTEKYFGENKMENFHTDSTTIHQFLSKLSERMPGDWKHIAVYLNITYKDIGNITYQPEHDLTQYAFNVLKMWQASKYSATHQLIRALSDMHRADALKIIFEEFDKRTGTEEGYC